MAKKPDHRARARDAWPYLVRRAHDGGEPFTYKQLGTLVGVHYRAVGFFLYVIQRSCEQNNWPRLTGLVVHAGERLPGGGFAGARDFAGLERELTNVRAFDWPREAPF